MSEETLRLAREAYDAWSGRDLDRLLALTAEDYEKRDHSGVLGIAEAIDGREGLRRVFEEWYSGPWGGVMRLAVNRLIDLGDDRVLALVTLGEGGEASGEVQQSQLVRFRDGLVARTDGYPSWDEGLRAAGLTEIPD
jgi:ketosteroid isomerase-like protein